MLLFGLVAIFMGRLTSSYLRTAIRLVQSLGEPSSLSTPKFAWLSKRSKFAKGIIGFEIRLLVRNNYTQYENSIDL